VLLALQKDCTGAARDFHQKDICLGSFTFAGGSIVGTFRIEGILNLPNRNLGSRLFCLFGFLRGAFTVALGTGSIFSGFFFVILLLGGPLFFSTGLSGALGGEGVAVIVSLKLVSLVFILAGG